MTVEDHRFSSLATYTLIFWPYVCLVYIVSYWLPLSPTFSKYTTSYVSLFSLSRKLSLTGECRLRGFSHRISPQLAIWRYKENAMVFKKNGRGEGGGGGCSAFHFTAVFSIWLVEGTRKKKPKMTPYAPARACVCNLLGNRLRGWEQQQR